VRRDPPISTGAAMGAFARWMAGAEDDAEHLGLDRKALQPRSRTHARMGRMMRRAGMIRPRTQDRFRERMAAFFEDVDLLLSPVTTGAPLAARPWHERSFGANVAANARWAPWTAAWNLAGLPALVLPAGIRPEGLPLAVQFVGPAGAEARLLWIAGELEHRQPWRRYAPVFDPTASPAPAPV
jgi:amidase